MALGTKSSNMKNTAAPGAKQNYALPLTLITSLFFLWAFGVNLNDILIPHLKAAFRPHRFPVFLHPDRFFRRLFSGGLPGRLADGADRLQEGHPDRLLLCATGALLFLPAASVRTYAFFFLLFS